MNSRTPREDFLVSMFQDDPRLVEELRRSPTKFNWYPIIAAAVLVALWIGIVLWRKGWL